MVSNGQRTLFGAYFGQGLERSVFHVFSNYRRTLEMYFLKVFEHQPGLHGQLDPPPHGQRSIKGGCHEFLWGVPELTPPPPTTWVSEPQRQGSRLTLGPKKGKILLVFRAKGERMAILNGFCAPKCPKPAFWVHFNFLIHSGQATVKVEGLSTPFDRR